MLAIVCLPIGCGGGKKKVQEDPPPEPVEVQGKLVGALGKKLVVTLEPDDEVTRKGKAPSAAIVDAKTEEFRTEAIPGKYKAKAIVPALGAGGAGSAAGTTGLPGQVTSLGDVVVPAEGTKSLVLKLP